MQDAKKESDANLPLFRPEAISGRQYGRFGKVLIHQPIGYTVTACIAVALALMIASFAYFGTYTKKSTVSGLLVPESGVLRVSSSSAGYVSEIHVAEGQRVKAGEPILVISGARFSSAGNTQALILDQLDRRVYLLERSKSLSQDRLISQRKLSTHRFEAIDD